MEGINEIELRAELAGLRDKVAALMAACYTPYPHSGSQPKCVVCGQMRWHSKPHARGCPLSDLAASAAAWRHSIESEALEKAAQLLEADVDIPEEKIGGPEDVLDGLGVPEVLEYEASRIRALATDKQN